MRKEAKQKEEKLTIHPFLTTLSTYNCDESIDSRFKSTLLRNTNKI